MADAEPIPLARPEIGPREEELVLEVMRSRALSLGPMLARFERDFARWLGVADAVAVASGTAALHLGVRALEWTRGEEVITTPLSFIASANCLLYEGVTPVFCDVDAVTLTMDPQHAESARGERTAGLLPVHIFGYPADLPALEALAKARGLGILEDACQALGASDAEGRTVGTRGNPTAFAFYANKQITTAEGGMLVPPGPEVAERARSERNQGRAEDMSTIEHRRLGFNYRLSDLGAALGVAQLARAEELLSRRAKLASMYGERLAAIGASLPGSGDPDGLLLPCEDRGAERRGWFTYVVQLPAHLDRDAVIAGLAQRGIASKPYLPCIHLQPVYRERFGFRGGEFPVAERFAERALALPFFAGMQEEHVDRVTTAIAEATGQRAWA